MYAIRSYYGALGGALLLQKNGMETVMQVCCRDRNRLALQADLLAASASGVNHIMVVTGDDPSFGDHHQAKAVYDINIFELLGALKKLQEGHDMARITSYNVCYTKLLRFWESG